MPIDRAFNCDHIQTVSKNKVGPLITKLFSGKIEGLKKAICFALSL